MEKIEIIKALVEDASNEIDYIEKFEEIRKKAYEKDSESPEFKKWINSRNPSRARIKDDLKMMRRISLDIEKEL